METSWKVNFPSVEPQPVDLDGPAVFGWRKGKDGKIVLTKIPNVGYIVPFYRI